MAKKRKIIEVSESESESSETESEGVIEISSSTCDDDDDVSDSDDDDSDYDSEDEYDDDDGSGESESSENEAEENVYVDMNDEESVCNKVIRSLRDKTPIENLKWNECKVFLRRHGLRLTGTKEECNERIKEFWRLKDGNGEALYPRSSFVINCTGDVCRGDVVLFRQKVYDKNRFSKMKRRGRVLGIRTVAGRIVNDSYGAAKQQHTFTVEVLWSQGANKLAPLVPLLVKGRNLYRMKTFRQRWKNENKRLEVLDEKHQRGAAARHVRDVRRAKIATKMNKPTTTKCAKSCKVSQHSGPSGAKASKRAKTNVKKQGKALEANKKSTPRKKLSQFRASTSKNTQDLRIPTSHKRSRNPTQDHQIREPPQLQHNDPSQAFYPFQSNVNPIQQPNFPSIRISVSIGWPSHPQPVLYPFPRPVPQRQDFNHDSYDHPAYLHPARVYDSQFPGPMDHPSFHPSYSNMRRWR